MNLQKLLGGITVKQILISIFPGFFILFMLEKELTEMKKWEDTRMVTNI